MQQHQLKKRHNEKMLFWIYLILAIISFINVSRSEQSWQKIGLVLAGFVLIGFAGINYKKRKALD